MFQATGLSVSRKGDSDQSDTAGWRLVHRATLRHSSNSRNYIKIVKPSLCLAVLQNDTNKRNAFSRGAAQLAQKILVPRVRAPVPRHEQEI